MNYRENYFKVIKFDYPEYIPMDFGINKACYDYYDHDALFTLMEEHPFLFPNFVRPEEPYKPVLPLTGRKDQPWTKVYNATNHAMYTNHPYKRDVIGTPEIISQISQEKWNCRLKTPSL